MPYHWKWLGLTLACLAGVARADPWDDFANNLFSDLAPLLALFGERATMQFMSQSLGWEDCVILAMAPLGIITILVSAIRVGGPAWLKAVVGRARENMSAAEMELMSSTSKEVCELYNGQIIVRCQGSTPVWEFIYLIPIDSQNQSKIKVVTLEDACKEDKSLLYELKDGRWQGEPPSCEEGSPPRGASKIAKIFHDVFTSSALPSTGDGSLERGDGAETSEQPPSEPIYVIRNMGSDAPNIILNLQNHNSDRKELKIYAMIGVILQLCVLAFFGIITYHPTIKNSFRKDDQRVDDYAFPLAISGTLVLALGVFLCGTVVEKSTKETHYKKNEKYKMRIVWIQQKQTVGDQVFEPFATFPGAPRDVVTTSRRCDDSEAPQREPLTIIGICAGLFGFIIQFIGLRAMNSAATLAQLGVVGIMTAIRAWVRRRLATPPQKEKLTSGFELDTWAWALTLLNHSRNERPSTNQGPAPANDAKQGDTHQQAEKDPLDLVQAERMSLEKQKHCLWSLRTGNNVDHRPFLQTRPPSNSRAQQVFETRWNLTRLAQFQGASASEAINLVTAMEKIMSVLFPLRSGEPERAWTWPLAVVYRDSESAEPQCYVNISLTGKDGAWKVLADQLESVLSLCLFTAQKEQSRSKEGQAEFNLNDKNDDWLRQRTIHSGVGLRFFGAENPKKTDQLIQDLRWWAPETFDILAEIQEVTGSNSSGPNTDNNNKGKDQNNQPVDLLVKEARRELDEIIRANSKLDDINVDGIRVVGYDSSGPQSPRQRHFRNFSADPQKRGTLAIESVDSLEKLFAKDLLFSFFFSAAKSLDSPLQGEITTRATTANTSVNDTSTVLVTEKMTSLAAELGRLGFGNEQEVWLSIITPLSLAEKLPFPRPLFDLARARAQELRREKRWHLVNNEYLKFWKQTQRYTSSSQNICAKGTALLVEHVCDMKEKMKLKAFEHPASPYSDSLEEALDELSSKLQGYKGYKDETDFFAQLSKIYQTQKRSAHLDCIQSLACSPPQGNFPDFFGVTKLHLNAMELRVDDQENCNYTVWDDVNPRDICDWTPLHYSVARGRDTLTSYLLSCGADPNLEDLHGFTPVHYACLNEGMNDIIVDLQTRGGKLDVCGLEGATPMHLAAGNGNHELIKSWEELVLPNRGGRNPRTESFPRLRDHEGRMPIHWAVIHGHEKVVQEFRSTIDEPDMYGWTPLHLAVLSRERGLDLIKAILQVLIETEKRDEAGRTPLLLACDPSYLNEQAAHQLIQSGADVNAMNLEGSTALSLIVKHGKNPILIETLVSKGARIDVCDRHSRGQPLLHFAAAMEDTSVLKILLKALDHLDPKACSPVIDVSDRDGQTALHRAASRKQIEVIDLLLSAKADPNRQDERKRTPLHHALMRDKKSKILLGKNESSTAEENKKHRATTVSEEEQKVSLKIVEMLVKHSGNPRVRDARGRMPLDIARKYGHTLAAKYLERPLELDGKGDNCHGMLQENPKEQGT